ncbi:MAG TPA: hypothetical protein VK004_04720 [Ignavibacteria bacterium]|nr:hypothetical protein [Ignavibacteria bacterium]
MKLIRSFIILAVLIPVFYGCSASPLGSSQDEEFLAAAEDFITAFNNKDVTGIDKYIDIEYGVFVLHNPGAYIVPVRLNSFGEIMSMEGEYDIANLKVTKVNCASPRRGLEPIYSCDAPEGWNKQGCFYGIEKTIALENLYRDLISYDLLTPEEAAEPMRIAAQSEKNHTYFIYNTDETIGFHFGKRNGKFYIIAIDRVIPCSA